MIGSADTLDASILLPFGEEERLFRLGMDQLLALEEKCDCPFAVLHDRLMRRAWFLRDVSETLRLGLIGGGMELRAAKDLVERSCVPGRIDDCATIAFYVLAVVMDAPKALRLVLGKDAAAVGASGATTVASPSSPSTASPPSPASTPSASAASPSGATSPSSKAGTKRMPAQTRRQTR